jgi:hypothetical protein
LEPRKFVRVGADGGGAIRRRFCGMLVITSMSKHRFPHHVDFFGDERE